MEAGSVGTNTSGRGGGGGMGGRGGFWGVWGFEGLAGGRFGGLRPRNEGSPWGVTRARPCERARHGNSVAYDAERFAGAKRHVWRPRPGVRVHMRAAAWAGQYASGVCGGARLLSWRFCANRRRAPRRTSDASMPQVSHSATAATGGRVASRSNLAADCAPRRARGMCAVPSAGGH